MFHRVNSATNKINNSSQNNFSNTDEILDHLKNCDNSAQSDLAKKLFRHLEKEGKCLFSTLRDKSSSDLVLIIDNLAEGMKEAKIKNPDHWSDLISIAKRQPPQESVDILCHLARKLNMSDLRISDEMLKAVTEAIGTSDVLPESKADLLCKVSTRISESGSLQLTTWQTLLKFTTSLESNSRARVLQSMQSDLELHKFKGVIPACTSELIFVTPKLLNAEEAATVLCRLEETGIAEKADEATLICFANAAASIDYTENGAKLLSKIPIMLADSKILSQGWSCLVQAASKLPPQHQCELLYNMAEGLEQSEAKDPALFHSILGSAETLPSEEKAKVLSKVAETLDFNEVEDSDIWLHLISQLGSLPEHDQGNLLKNIAGYLPPQHIKNPSTWDLFLKLGSNHQADIIDSLADKLRSGNVVDVPCWQELTNRALKLPKNEKEAALKSIGTHFDKLKGEHPSLAESNIEGLPQSAGINNVNTGFEGKTLPAATYQFRHPNHGDLTIERCAKPNASDQVSFVLKLAMPNGVSAALTHNMTVTNYDDHYHGRSTFGYGVLDLPGHLNGKKISYMYHLAAAETAKELGVDLFVVQNCGSEILQHACTASGFTDCGQYTSDLGAPPQAVIDGSKNKATQHNWT